MKPAYTNLLFGLLMAGAAAGLLSGLYSGLMLFGLPVPQPPVLTGPAHGPLMINGFLAALISLERAAAMERKWTYAAPISFVLSTGLFIAGHILWSSLFLLTGSFLLVAVLFLLWRQHPSTWHMIMLLGGISLLIGNAGFALGLSIPELVGWWIAFPVLTIFGERLELNRLMRPPEKAQWIFTGLIFLWMGTLALVHITRYTAWIASGILLIVMAGWLLKYDIARRTIRTVEWTRFSALNMLTAYGWIILAGIFGLIYGLPWAGPIYDAILHLYFVGFVFSMIFAHAAVIIPALTGLIVPWSRYFYLPYALLNLFLLARVIGDIFWLPELRSAGAYGNVAAILLFLGGILSQGVRKIKEQR
ncbi:hypothetical protein QA596_08655 [Balneolales bacterium ANBcel1]|nr:hypothetical protein [Balneolales bacterium ANBcel1]